MVYVNIMFPLKPFSTGFITDKNDSSASGSSSAYQSAYQAPVSTIQFPQIGKDPLSDYHHLSQRVPAPPVQQHWSSPLPSAQQQLHHQQEHPLAPQIHSQSNDHKKYQCSRCDLRFTRNSSLKRHIKSKHLLLKYKCDICPNYFNKRKDYLQRHMFIKHGMCREEFNRKNYKQDYVYEEDDRHQHPRVVRKFSFDSQSTQGDHFDDDQSHQSHQQQQQLECGSASSTSPTLPQDQLYTPPSMQAQPQPMQQNQLAAQFVPPSQQRGFAYPTSEPNRMNSQELFLDYFSPSTNQLQPPHQTLQQQMMQAQQTYYYQHYQQQQMQQLPPTASHLSRQAQQPHMIDEQSTYVTPVLSSKMITKGLYDHLNSSNSPFNSIITNSSTPVTQGQLYQQGHPYQNGDQEIKREDISKTPQLEAIVKEEN